MVDFIKPEIIWQNQVVEIKNDYRRLENLITNDLLSIRPDLEGILNQLESQLLTGLHDLHQFSNQTSSPAWKMLSKQRKQFNSISESLLEVLGGIADRSGIAENIQGVADQYAALAEEWLSGLYQHIGVDSKSIVVSGIDTGPAQELEYPLRRMIVRTPFLDWDLWHLPLLGRTAGYLLIEEGKVGNLGTLADKFASSIACTQQLATEMLATAIVGPVYAIAVFVLEFDYSSLTEHENENQSLSPVERAAAILETLEMMKSNKTKDTYLGIQKKLVDLWRTTVAIPGQAELLKQIREKYEDWHRTIMDGVVRPKVEKHLSSYAESWKQAEAWGNYLATQNAPKPTMESARYRQISEMVGGVWLHRIDCPGEAEKSQRDFFSFLSNSGEHSIYRYPCRSVHNQALPIKSNFTAEIRLDRLDNRQENFEKILEDHQIEQQDAVSGKYLQNFSRQDFDLDTIREDLTQKKRLLWEELAKLERASVNSLQEALGFLDGLRIRYHKLDREKLADGSEGPSICALADRMLYNYASSTGVNWNARTVLGPGPFLALSTDIVRVRFPDWSLWNLPLMAHEFGHVVSRSTFQFYKYKNKLPKEHQRRAEELFADVFATYVAGPSFACSAILLQFNPETANLSRGEYPSHQERVNAILYTLDEMNFSPIDDVRMNICGAISEVLRDSWNSVTEHAESVGESYSWAEDFYNIINRSYRLGASFTNDRWAQSQRIAIAIMNLLTTNPTKIRRLVNKYGLSMVPLDDILNALWCARIQEEMLQGNISDSLRRKSQVLGRIILSEGEQ